MPVKTIEKEIDGHNIKIVQFHAVRGFKIKARLYKVVIPVLSSLVDLKDLKTDKNLLDANIDFSRAFVSLGAVLDPDVLFSLLSDLLSGAFIDGQMIDEKVFNETFIGNYNLAYKIAYEVIQANGFFDLGGIGNLMKNQLNLGLKKD
jgi:hypothetical protein